MEHPPETAARRGLSPCGLRHPRPGHQHPPVSRLLRLLPLPSRSGSTEDPGRYLSEGLENRLPGLMSSCDPWPIGHPGKLWARSGACDGVDVSRERRQGMGPLPGKRGLVSSLSSGNSQGEGCWHFRNWPIGTSVTALSGANTVALLAGCFYNQTQEWPISCRTNCGYGKMFVILNN